MIGVLLTSTCWYEGIDKETFAARVEELANCALSLKSHIKQPYELIIADNSPPDMVPSEQIMKLCPADTVFMRYAKNPGKSVGEAEMIRDGFHLSYSRGHKWLLKLTGRYFMFGDFVLDDAIAMLEARAKRLYVHLISGELDKIPWAKNHPLYEKLKGTGALLTGVATQIMLAQPGYLVESGVFKNDYLYKENRWVNYEQLFWTAIRGLDFLHWPNPPVDGYEVNRATQITIQQRLKQSYYQPFETTEDYASFPHADIRELL